MLSLLSSRAPDYNDLVSSINCVVRVWGCLARADRPHPLGHVIPELELMNGHVLPQAGCIVNRGPSDVLFLEGPRLDSRHRRL